jgi:hypothetical protein
MRKTAAMLLAIVIPAYAGAQTFQPGRLPAASRDSFEVVYQGQPIGTVTMALAKTGDNFIFVGDVRLPRMGLTQLDSIVFNATTLAPSLITNNGSMMGQSGVTRVTVANGKATGTAQQPGPGGMQTRTIDAAVAPGVIGDGVDPLLIQTLDFSDGMSMTYQAFDAKTGKTKPYALKVVGKENVTVPAGTMEAWKIELTSDEVATIWVSTADPKKLVMLRLESAQLELRRASK